MKLELPYSRSFLHRVSVSVLLVVTSYATTPIAFAETETLKILETVRTALSKNPRILISHQLVQQQKGAHLSSQGQFDVITNASVNGVHQHEPLNSSDRSDAGFSHEEIDEYSYQAGLSKQFRQGFSLEHDIQLKQEYDNALNPEGANRSSVNLTLKVPLLRGYGRSVTTAQERAAEYNVDASLYTLRNQIAKTVQTVVTQYWTYKAAMHTLEIRQTSESLAQQAVDQTSDLLKNKKVEASDLEHAKANLADRVSTRRNAEFALQTAQHQLGLTLGIPYEDFQKLPLPSESFPDPLEESSFTPSMIGKYLSHALERRADLLAIKKQEEAIRAQLVGSKNGLLPQLDLSIQGGYEGLVDGQSQRDLPQALNSSVMGANAFVSLTYQFPVQNRSARGQVIQQEAQSQQLQIQRLNLERTIQSQVRLALENLRTSSESIRRSTEAVKAFKNTYQQQVKQFQQKKVGFIVLVEGEENLASARVRLVNAQQQYASALIALRFESGLLLEGPLTHHQDRITHETLMHIPPF